MIDSTISGRYLGSVTLPLAQRRCYNVAAYTVEPLTRYALRREVAA